MMSAKAAGNQMVQPCAEWWDEMDNHATTPFSYCPSTASLSVRPHSLNARWNRCQEDLISFQLGQLEETIRTIIIIIINEVQLTWRKVAKLQGHVTKKRVMWSVLGPENAGKVQTSADVRTPSYCVMKTIHQDLKSINLSLNEAIDVTQKRLLWRLMSTFGTTHSWWWPPQTTYTDMNICRWQCKNHYIHVHIFLLDYCKVVALTAPLC